MFCARVFGALLVRNGKKTVRKSTAPINFQLVAPAREGPGDGRERGARVAPADVDGQVVDHARRALGVEQGCQRRRDKAMNERFGRFVAEKGWGGVFPWAASFDDVAEAEGAVARNNSLAPWLARGLNQN